LTGSIREEARFRLVTVGGTLIGTLGVVEKSLTTSKALSTAMRLSDIDAVEGSARRHFDGRNQHRQFTASDIEQVGL
jgi:hypothetical protein